MVRRGNLFVAKVTLLIILVSHVPGCGRPATVAPSEGETAVGERAGAPGASGSNQPTITASPNPIPTGNALGSTRIAWNTGDDSWAQIYVSIDGVESKMVAQGASGAKDIDWIKAGRSYEFRLYAGKDRNNLLTKVLVTRVSQ